MRRQIVLPAPLVTIVTVVAYLLPHFSARLVTTVLLALMMPMQKSVLRDTCALSEVQSQRFVHKAHSSQTKYNHLA